MGAVKSLQENDLKSGWWDLNPRSLGPEPSALAPALQPVKKPVVGSTAGSSGATGLEPVISGLTGRRDKPASPRPRIVVDETA